MVDPPPFFHTEQRFQDDDDILVMFLVRMIMFQRVEKQRYPRMDWEQHLALKDAVATFPRYYHMTVESFKKLVRILSPLVKRDEHRQACAGGLIPPEFVVAMGIRFLGGLAPKDAASEFGVSISAAHAKIKIFIEAVNSSFTIDVPRSTEELERCAAQWNEKSGAFGIYHGCVGAIDGWLCCIYKPKKVDNTAHYFSGHYQRYGVNVQAVVDANLRFIYFGVIGPGRTNDARAFNRCIELRQWIDSLPDRYFIIGDNAYPLSDKVLIPFSGAMKHVPTNRTYNFYLSQLRIRVEMAFGLLTTKWQIFRTPIGVHLNYLTDICGAAARLHNFVIDNEGRSYARDLWSPTEFDVQPIDSNTPGVSQYNKGYLNTLPTLASRGIVVDDSRRKFILGEILSHQLERPIDNLIRNQELDEQSATEEEIDGL